MGKLSLWNGHGLKRELDAWIHSAFGHGLSQFISLYSIKNICPNLHKQVYNYLLLHSLCHSLSNI